MVALSRFILGYTPLYLSLSLTRSFRSFSHKVKSFTTNMNRFPCIATETNCIADVHLVPMFSDNYGYLIVDPATKTAVTVDPGDGEAILTASRELGLTLTTVLCTHKHGDHVGGNDFLKQNIPNLEIIGTKYEDIPAVTKPVGDGEEFSLFRDRLRVRTIFTPCHTAGHVLYYISNADQCDEAAKIPMLFSGDTLFVGGCGRFFEGTAAQMLENMDKIASLPLDTLVFCAHEYTESNYKFLAHVDPSLQEKYDKIRLIRANGLPTIPSTIGDELQHNLFAKCRDERTQSLVGFKGDPIATMHELRTRKNGFK